MADFLITELLDDATGDAVEVGLRPADRRRASPGQVRGNAIEPSAERAAQEELGLQELQVHGEPDAVHIAGFDGLATGITRDLVRKKKQEEADGGGGRRRAPHVDETSVCGVESGDNACMEWDRSYMTSFI